MFSFGETEKQLRAKLKEQGISVTGTTHKFEKEDKGITVHYDDGFTLIRLRGLPICPDSLGVLAHEIFHAVCYLMDFVGVKLSDQSNESYAYCIEYLTRAVLEAISGDKKH